MEGFSEIDDALRGDDEWADERSVLRGARAALADQRPACLVDVRAEWSAPYLSLTFVHDDGTVLEISDGDGYTAIVGGAVNFHGYLPPPDLIAVIRAALTGGLTYVRCERLGLKVADYFEVVDRGDEQLGRGSYGIAGFPGALLGKLPLLPESVRRIRVDFDRRPALGTVP